MIGFPSGSRLSLVSYSTSTLRQLLMHSRLYLEDAHGHAHMHSRVYRESMFFKKKISATHNASAWGLVRRDPKRFLISTMFRGSLGHFKFDRFYIVDFHSALAFLDRDLRSED